MNVRARDAQGNWGPVTSFLLKDVVTITSVTYARSTLQVVVTSSSSSRMILRAPDYPRARFVFRRRTNDYRAVIRRVPVNPGVIRVTSSGGGSDTKPVPFP